MSFNINARLILLAGLLVHATVSVAHHSGEMFEREKTLTLTGTVKQFRYINPHSWLIVDVTNEDGSVTTWGFEAEGPSVLTRGGVYKGDLPPGTKITITFNPMKDGRPAGLWSRLVKEDGSVLNWRTPGEDIAGN